MLVLFQAKSNPGTIRGDFCVHIGRYKTSIVYA